MNNKRNDEEARRSFWIEQMEAAHTFMKDIIEYPVEECGEELISLQESVKAAGIAVEFSPLAIPGRHDFLFYLRAGLIKDFLAAAKEMNERGWVLKVEDAFRTRKMQTAGIQSVKVLDIVLQKTIWEAHGKLPTPDLVFQRVTGVCATCPKIGTHMSGSAIDISVLWAKDHSEVDRGGPYCEMSELSAMSSPFVSKEAARNRIEISELMRRHGFIAYPYEFWHYSKDDAYAEYMTKSGKPAKYGPIDFDKDRATIAAIQNPAEPLISMDEIKRLIDSALSRLNSNKL